MKLVKLCLIVAALVAIVPVVSPQQAEAQVGRQRPGVLGRLMELERRKNERLRQMFRS